MVLQPIAPSEGASRYRVFALFGALTTATLGRSSRRAKSDPQSCPIQPPHGVPGYARLAGHINPSRVRLVSSDTPTAFASLSTYRDTWLPPLANVSSDSCTPVHPQAPIIMATVQQHSSLEVNEANEKGQHIYANDIDSSRISTPGDVDDLPDPDAGKSDAERAALVRHALIFACWNSLTSGRTKHWSGRWTSG